MTKMFIAFWAATQAGLLAQPLIANRSVYNAASYVPYGLPGGSIARGSLFTIFGSNLGPANSPPLSFPLSTTLGGVSIQVSQGTTSVAAIPVFVSPGQVNAIMPSNAPLGPVLIRLTNVSPTPPVRANVVNASFGIFAVNSAGFGPGVMQNFVAADNLPVNAPSIAAQPGQTIILYGTGLGPGLNPDNQAPTSGTLPTPVEVFVGGKLVTSSYSGRSACCSALDQINFVVPPDTPLGCWVPVQVRTAGTTVSNTVTMAISADGSPCSDPANAISKPFLAGSKLGIVSLFRTDVTEDVGLPAPANVTTDTAMLSFQQQTNTLFAFNPIYSLPPPGTCTTYAASGDLFDGDSISGSDVNARFLNAGTTFSVVSPTSDRRTMGRPATNVRNYQPLGYSFTGSKVPATLFLNAGNYVLTGSGGPDVGPIQTNFAVSTPLGPTWTNRDQTLIVNRAQGFTVNWTGVPASGQVIIAGGGVDTPTNSTALFVCLAAPGATSLTVPPQVLANIAPTRDDLLKSKGVVYVGALPTSNPASFTASGLDAGIILPGGFTGKTVIFQ